MTPGQMEDFGQMVERFANAVGAMIEAAGLTAHNQQQGESGGSGTYGQYAFEEILTRYGLKIEPKKEAA